MQETIADAFKNDRLIDITTTGRKTGLLHRIEISFQYIDGDVYITGFPGRRGWYANLLSDPNFTLHLKERVQLDLPAKATPIVEDQVKREFFRRMKQRSKSNDQMDLEAWVQHSPLIKVALPS